MSECWTDIHRLIPDSKSTRSNMIVPQFQIHRSPKLRHTVTFP
jgi:hypothetical protein